MKPIWITLLMYSIIFIGYGCGSSVPITDDGRGKVTRSDKTEKGKDNTRDDDINETLDKALSGGTIDGAGKNKSDDEIYL